MPVKVINRPLIYLLLILICFLQNVYAALDSITSLLINESESHLNGSIAPNNTTAVDGFQLIKWNWHHIQTPITVSLWLLLASIAKIFFHVHKRFGEAIPDSALLIVVGLILGYALKKFDVDENYFSLNADIFFLYLLPPIIFDAGYFMPNRQLFENLDSVILFSVVGTIFNTIAIGFTLYLLSTFQLFSVDFSLVEILLFTSLISAVDPVAVITVFEEVHVNAFLFVNVFGEALFNDGVAVVLYQMFQSITKVGVQNLSGGDYLLFLVSFFVISFGGVLIGIFYAIVVSLATRFTNRVKIVAPVFIFVIPYLAYITAELFGLSSILAIVSCGIVMKQYVKGNVSHDALSSVKYFVKTLAQCSETVIFMFLGLSTMSNNHRWDTNFVAVTVALCLIYRSIGVVVQCAILNRFRKVKFSFVDQFVLSYGGLRGAIAFGLAVSMNDAIGAKQMFVTTCIAVIFFTVFVQGITIRPLLHWLKVERLDEHRMEKMIEKVYTRYCDYTMAGIEDIAGQKGANAIRDAFERFNAKILKPLLMRHERRRVFDATDIIRAYKRIALQEAVEITLRQQLKKEELRNRSTVHLAFEKSSINEGMTKKSVETTDEGTLRRENGEKKLSNPLINEENTEALYSLFGQLLDRKIAELQCMWRTSNSVVLADRRLPCEDDIKDNYMEIIQQSSQDSLVRQSRAAISPQQSVPNNSHPTSNGGGVIPPPSEHTNDELPPASIKTQK